MKTIQKEYQITEIINYEKKDMIPLIDERIKFYEKQKQCHVCEKGFFRKEKDKFKHKKSEIIVIILENLEQLLIEFAI